MAFFRRTPPAAKLDLTIVGMDELADLAGQPFTRVISISDMALKSGRKFEEVLRGAFPQAAFQFSYFEDVEFEKIDAPDRNAVYRILLFSQDFSPADRVLIHCRAGVSRSTAIACAILAQHTPAGQEKDVVAQVRRLRPMMLPNFLIIRLADDILQRGGKLTNAVAKARGLA